MILSLLLKERIDHVEQSIREACLRSGRDRDEVNIIAVTKYVSLSMTEAVLQQGLIHIGENRVHSALPKWEALQGNGIWHFIGHLQSNKVNDVLGKFKYIHSLDRLSLAKQLEKKAAVMDLEIQAFLQINVSGEDSKQGLSPEQAIPFLKELSHMPHIKVIGLMTMAPYEDDPEMTRPVFRGLRELRDEINSLALTEQPIQHLSMGMSNDFEVAIEEGATWIRLGSILVGKGEESQ